MNSFSRPDVALENSLITDLGIITVGAEIMGQFYGGNFLAKLDFVLHSCWLLRMLMDNPLFNRTL